MPGFPLYSLFAADRPRTRGPGDGGGIYADRAKRGLDVALVVLAAPLVLPLIVLLAMLVRRDGGPAFYGHLRVGRDRAAFHCLKLRTMVADADARLADHLRDDAEARREWAATRKLRHDPRVTRIGRFLRRTSLDELPQLINVLRGEMSLVGPRPVTDDELVRYGVNRTAYLSVRPGLTGLWQVSGRGATSYERRVHLDAEYVARIGMFTDLGILVRTVGVVLAGAGAS